MKILSIICVYFPENNNNLLRLVEVLAQCGDVYIVINGGDLGGNIASNKKVNIINNGVNYGTYAAYNLVFTENPDYDYYWLWDQDTYFDIENARLFLSEAKILFENDNKISAVTTSDTKNFVSPFNQKLLLAKASTTLIDYKRANQFLSSIFDLNFFLDLGDWDFCMRLYKGGGYIAEIPGILISHSLGEPVTTIFGEIRRPSEFRLFIQGLAFYRYIFIYKRADFISFLLICRTLYLPLKNLIFKNGIKRTMIYLNGIWHAHLGMSVQEYIFSKKSSKNLNKNLI